jgi:hypothetical protein
MSFAMTDAQVRQHIHDVRHEVARCRGYSPRPAQVHQAAWRYPSGQLHRLPRLRRRVGYRLVEAGLHLLADSPGA